MAVKEREGYLGTSVYSGSKANWYGGKSDTQEVRDEYGQLLDFNVLYKGQNVSGTLNPSKQFGNTISYQQDFANVAKDMLSQDENFSLSTAKNAVGKNTSDNPFFSEFFNYYLGVAQERQANLQKSISKGDLLAGSGTAASMIGGSLL